MDNQNHEGSQPITVTALWYQENHPDRFVTFCGIFTGDEDEAAPQIQATILRHLERLGRQGIRGAHEADFYTRTGYLDKPETFGW
jgi:hypothetical protein